MSVLSDIRSLLLSDGAIAALIGTRIYPDALPQKPTLPAIAYQQVSGIRDFNLDGPVDLAELRVQFDCWTLTATERGPLADALRLKLNGFRGEIGGSPATGRISGAFLENEQDFYEDDTKLYRRSMDYILYVGEDLTA